MHDNHKQVIAERLYFNERPEARLQIDLSTEKEIYDQRELTSLHIQTTTINGDPANTNLSILVINKEQLGELQKNRQSILSYFLLSSDLKGEIENPGYYFSSDVDRHNDLDALLLTQGWRKYKYIKPLEHTTLEQIAFKPETQLTVSGTISDQLFRKKKKEGELTMMTFGHEMNVYTQVVSNDGKFRFIINDDYGMHLPVVIQSANKSGVKKDYHIELDKNMPPGFCLNLFKLLKKWIV